MRLNSRLKSATETFGYKSDRKATSNQKERVQSSKLTSGIARIGSGTNSSFNMREKLLAKKALNNSHLKKNPARRPVTASTKKHNFVHDSMKVEKNKPTDAFNRTIKERRSKDEDLAVKSKLKKQKSIEARPYSHLASAQTPNILKGKADLLNSNSNHTESTAKGEMHYDPSYMTVERDYARRRQQTNLLQEEYTHTSTTPASASIKERSTITPSRYIPRTKCKVFKIEPEAFQQPNADETENLIVNLEDIVKEEQVIFTIQECLNQAVAVEQHCLKWWDTTNTSSVKEMQLFFEEESSKKLIRQQQIILVLVVGYIELMESKIIKSLKIMSSVKNILANAHKNYLVFVEFI